MSFRVRVKALKSATSATVEIDDVVDAWGTSAKAVRNALRDTSDAKKLNVYINSAGGEVTEGLAIYNLLCGHSAFKTVEIGGLAASMASIIAMAGNKIVMPKNSFMMIHNPWAGVMGEADDMRQTADLLDKFRDQLAGIYVARTGQSLDAVLAAMAAETWMTGDEALALGYCTSVTEPTKVAARFDASRFTHAPKALQRATTKKGKQMDLAELIALLGLPEESTAEDCAAAIKALQDAAKPDEEENAPPEDSDGDEDEDKEKMKAKARREAAQALAAQGSSAVLAELKKLNKKIDGIGTRVDGSEKESLIKANLSKFSSAMAKKAAKWPLDVIKDYIASAQDVDGNDDEPEADGAPRGAAALGGGAREIKLTPADYAVCKATGRSPLKLLAFKKSQAEKEAV